MVAFTETWRPVPALPGYEASDLGRIRGPKGVRKLKRCARGYFSFGITGGRNVSVARCVCGAFNGSPFAGAEVDHINRERGLNLPHNLRWVTKAENLDNRQNRRGSAHGNAKLTEDIVREIRASETSAPRLAALYGVSRETIRDARSGKLWSHVHG